MATKPIIEELFILVNYDEGKSISNLIKSELITTINDHNELGYNLENFDIISQKTGKIYEINEKKEYKLIEVKQEKNK